MFRLWGKLYKDTLIIKDTVIEINDQQLSTQEKTNIALEEICYQFDLQKPMWLNDNNRDFPKYGKTTFRQDHFIEQVDFNYLEIEIIENDDN